MLADGELPLLQLLGLRKHFGGVRAVDGVDLVIRAGELCCVIGPNGAGKSTLFQLLSGQLLPTGSSSMERISREPNHSSVGALASPLRFKA